MRIYASMLQCFVIMSLAKESGVIPPLENIRSKAETVGMRLLASRFTDVLNSSPENFHPEFDDAYDRGREDNGMGEGVPAFVVSHFVHPEALRLAGIVQKIMGKDSRLRGVALTIASSVGSGHQGRLLEKGVPELKAIATRLGLDIVEYTRPEDAKRYGIRSNEPTVTRTLLKAVEAGKGLAMFPEASVQAGRFKPRPKMPIPVYDSAEEAKHKLAELGILDAPVHGMRRFDAKSIAAMRDIIAKKGKRAMFIPVAIDGVHRMVRPTDDRKNRATLKGVASVVLGSTLRAVHVKVGKPETIEEIEKMYNEAGIELTDQNLADYLGFKVAPLLPKDKRGVYDED